MLTHRSSALDKAWMNSDPFVCGHREGCSGVSYLHDGDVVDLLIDAARLLIAFMQKYGPSVRMSPPNDNGSGQTNVRQQQTVSGKR
jgi:hypothetical protein